VARQKLAIINHRPQDLVDVVSMSLGCYHEQYEDLEFARCAGPDPGWLDSAWRSVSSGNDATTRPMYPAAFAPYPGGLVPGAAGGAARDSRRREQPDRSVALFSNEGPWVRAHRPGTALVSTLPPFDGSRAPSIEMDGMGDSPAAPEPRGKNVRSTIDPDDFNSGSASERHLLRCADPGR
jgi:hypothetical protein